MKLLGHDARAVGSRVRRAVLWPAGISGARVRDGHVQPTRRRRIQVGEFDEDRFSRLFIADLRIERAFVVANFNLDVSAEVFNFFNRQTVLQQDADLTQRHARRGGRAALASGHAVWRPRAVLRPRGSFYVFCKTTPEVFSHSTQIPISRVRPVPGDELAI